MKDRTHNTTKPSGGEDNPPPPRTLSIDWRLYEEYLQDSTCSEEEKRELIETLWHIIVAFVDLGYGIEPVQLAMNEGRKDTVAMPPRGVKEDSSLARTFASTKRKSEEETIEEGVAE